MYKITHHSFFATHLISRLIIGTGSLIFILLTTVNSMADSVKVGKAIVDITPNLPVAVDGQMHLRVTNKVETPLEANILFLEFTSNEKKTTPVVFISCDLVTIPDELRNEIRAEITSILPFINQQNVIINATHTHTGAVVRPNWYHIPDSVLQPMAYIVEISKNIAKGVDLAYQSSVGAQLSWGIGEAKVAYNRRAVYHDGTAKMYGKTEDINFKGIEGYEDQDVQTLFFWNRQGGLLATCINISSPAQIVEGRNAINADYWHPVREKLRNRWHQEVAILGWIGAAGDQTPRPMYNLKARERMMALEDKEKVDFRSDKYVNLISERIVREVLRIFEIVQSDQQNEVSFFIESHHLELPMRFVSSEDYEEAKKKVAMDANDSERAVKYHRRMVWHQEVVDRYEQQKKDRPSLYRHEFNTLRIGDIAICTNSFELFSEFGIQIKSKSKALQTFVIQLVGPGTYVPTSEAVSGGHYSAIVTSNRVGPEGGQILVDSTIQFINRLWKP